MSGSAIMDIREKYPRIIGAIDEKSFTNRETEQRNDFRAFIGAQFGKNPSFGAGYSFPINKQNGHAPVWKAYGQMRFGRGGR